MVTSFSASLVRLCGQPKMIKDHSGIRTFLMQFLHRMLTSWCMQELTTLGQAATKTATNLRMILAVTTMLFHVGPYKVVLKDQLQRESGVHLQKECIESLEVATLPFWLHFTPKSQRWKEEYMTLQIKHLHKRRAMNTQ